MSAELGNRILLITHNHNELRNHHPRMMQARDQSAQSPSSNKLKINHIVFQNYNFMMKFSFFDYVRFKEFESASFIEL